MVVGGGAIGGGEWCTRRLGVRYTFFKDKSWGLFAAPRFTRRPFGSESVWTACSVPTRRGEIELKRFVFMISWQASVVLVLFLAWVWGEGGTAEGG